MCLLCLVAYSVFISHQAIKKACIVIKNTIERWRDQWLNKAGWCCCGQNTFCSFFHLNSEHLTHKNIYYKTDHEQSLSWQELLQMTIKGNMWTRWTFISVLSRFLASQQRTMGIFGSELLGAKSLCALVSVSDKRRSREWTQRVSRSLRP